MAGTRRSSSRTVAFEQKLELDVTGYHPFQAMRWLENVYEDCKRFGTAVRPTDEPVRFEQAPSLAFACSALAMFRGRRDGKPARLSNFSMGLYGPNGPMPLFLTEHVRDLQRSGDRATKAFLDIFHHRMIALFYRAWANAQPTVQADRPDEDRFALYVGALAGFALPTLNDRTTLPDQVRYHYVGHYGCQARHAEGLARILSDYFGFEFRVEEFVGHWIEIPPDARCMLGRDPETGSLGTTIALGERVRVTQDRFRVVAGPLSEADYLRLMPGGESLKRLVDLVRSYVGDELSWELQLMMDREATDTVRLGGRAQLGMNSWLLSKPLSEDPADMVIEPARVVNGEGAS